MNLQFKQLVEINAEMFEGMDNLEILWLYRNKLTSVPLNTFMKLTKLEKLSLSGNQIEELPNGLFKNNFNLETIYLHSNKLKFIGSTLFDGLTKLKEIDLSINQIEELPNGLFKNNVNLETIHLYSNKLKFIGSNLFNGLTKMNLVNLNNNVCINKRYTGSTAIIELKEDIKAQCFNPNEIVKPRSNFLINIEKVSNFLDQIMIGLMEADKRLKTKATKELIAN